MATYEIITETEGELVEGAPRYITLKVMFGDQSFTQEIVSALSGGELGEFLQAYADQYENEWNILNPPPPPLEQEPAS